ncbi:MAG TPA: phospholipase D family protein [Woeseiaceae bacterium]|nr:phospholipase D family protein [Woeseiaceae bacterium]
MNRITRIILLLVSPVFIGACAGIDFDYPRTPSTVIDDTAGTRLAGKYAAEAAQHPAGQSGFHELPNGIDALAARLLLAEQAEKSIDLQYYLIKDDLVGRAFLHALVRAADRGVRVRFLLDDMFTSGYDPGMAALDHHPNVEIRIFNPFNRGFAGRPLGAIADFGRVNRRMHNKSFTVDNQVTIIGGRNIAAEYFAAREDVNFGDLDVIGIGPVVTDVSEMFDLYWNHETALPVGAFYEGRSDPEGDLEQVRTRLARAYEDVPNSRYAEAVLDRYTAFARAGTEDFRWSDYRLVYDSPDKGLKEQADDTKLIAQELLEELVRAERQLIIVSPYFVPRKWGTDALNARAAQGIDVIVITNSLAANNQFSVHGGYAPARKPLLEGGVKIYEARPDSEVAGAELVAATGAKATLHTKAFIVDRDEAFIGSFNFDPRSANLNTEMGVVIRDPVLATEMADRVFARLKSDAYELFLDDGDLRWRGWDRDGRPFVEDKEPQTSWWDRFVAGFMRVLPIRSQL